MHREEYEGALAELCAARGPGVRPVLRARERLPHRQVPARRPPTPGRRAPARRRGYLDERGLAVLAALDELAAAHATTVAAVALAWLAAQPTVAAPIASARTPEQLAELLPMGGLELTAEELGRLTAASVVEGLRGGDLAQLDLDLRHGAGDECDLRCVDAIVGRAHLHALAAQPEAVVRTEQRSAWRRREFPHALRVPAELENEPSRDLVEIRAGVEVERRADAVEQLLDELDVAAPAH